MGEREERRGERKRGEEKRRGKERRGGGNGMKRTKVELYERKVLKVDFGQTERFLK